MFILTDGNGRESAAQGNRHPIEMEPDSPRILILRLPTIIMSPLRQADR
jgi:hypothetical protein